MKHFNPFNILAILLACIMLSSCDGNKIKKATATMANFEEAYKSQNSINIAEIYPKFSSLMGSRYKVDSFTIDEKKTEVKGDTVIFYVKSLWVNPFGKEFNNNMQFFVVPDENNHDRYVISNSKGLISLDEENLYRYAINKNSTIAGMLDVEKSDATSAYYSEFRDRKAVVREAISNHLSVSNLNWHTGGYYTDYASGSAMVTNNYPVSLPNVKYKIEYYTKNPANGGRLLAVDDGVVQYGEFSSGASKTFSWFTSNVGDANWASVECYIDNDAIIEEIVIMTSCI